MVNNSLYVWKFTNDDVGFVSWVRIPKAMPPAMKKSTSEVIM